MKAYGRFSGHFVTGHIDGRGRLLNVKRDAGSFVMTFEAPPPAQLVEKGSVAVDGVSLTVFDIGADTSGSRSSPTPGATTLGRLKPGGPVNVEYDILGKYALKNSGPKITRRFLADHGFRGF